MSESLVIVALLLACLIALLLIIIARREATAVRRQAAAEAASLREDVQRQLSEIQSRSEQLDKRQERIAVERQELKERYTAAEEELHSDRRSFEEQREEFEEQRKHELARITELSVPEAREELNKRLTDDLKLEHRSLVRQAETRAKAESEERARRIVTTAVQRLAVPTSSQSIVSLIELPSEEMKGRIIGKEGRNIRTFETMTGVNVVIDETPTSVMLSCFDPLRREIARDALQALVDDGRIHPERIESAVEEAQERVARRDVDAGLRAADEVGVLGLHDDLVATLGGLRLRTSFGQNVLAHLTESAHLAAMIATDLGLDADLARRAAFLHDVGKAVSHETEGTHALIGADMARRCGENHAVVNAIAAHHDEVPAETLEAVVVQIADALSAARPGARRDELDQYVERVDRLEKLAEQEHGVERAFAMNAGREVRIAVKPYEVTDEDARRMADDLAKRIQTEMTYPGEVKVVVIREMRATATAS